VQLECVGFVVGFIGRFERPHFARVDFHRNFGNLWTYNQIPNYLRTQYSLDQSDRYYYNNGYLYQVDPRSMLIQRVISALLR